MAKATTTIPRCFSATTHNQMAYDATGRRRYLIRRPAMRFYSSRIPVAFRFGTKPTGIRAISFIALRSIAETSFVTAFAT